MPLEKAAHPRRSTVLGALPGAAAAPFVHAQDEFPNRPIRFVIAAGAGGSTDGIVRMVSGRAATLLGQSIVVDNRPGGGDVVGTMIAAQEPADGYTHAGAQAALAVVMQFPRPTERKGSDPAAMAGRPTDYVSAQSTYKPA